MFYVRMKRKGGFTLVELLIVIVVIGVLSAMIMFAANEFIETSKSSNCNKQLEESEVGCYVLVCRQPRQISETV